MSAEDSTLLDIKGLCVSFRTPRGELFALRGVDLRVNAGEILGLVGESGSGKSVTLRAITQLLRANARISGHIVWRGQDLTVLSEAELSTIRGRQIATIFQEPMTALNPVMTIGQQIDESLNLLRRFDARGRRKRALELMGLVGIASAERRLHSYPFEFSGGMRQRAMIAIALASEPVLLLADEPTTALDVTIQDQILKLLGGLVDDLGLTLVIVTHDLGVVAETCENVCVMYAGRVVERGPVAEVFSNPRHAYTHALLRSVPGSGRARELLAYIPGQPPRLDSMPSGCAFAPRCGYCEDRCLSESPAAVAVSPDHVAACFAAGRLAEVREPQ